MMNKQIGIGNLAGDCRIKSIADNRAVVKFRVITNYRYYSTSQNQEITVSEGFNVELYATPLQAEYYQRNFTKGALVYFEGRKQTEQYTDAQQVTQRIEIVKVRDLDDVKLLHAAASRQQSDHSSNSDEPNRDRRTASNTASAGGRGERTSIPDDGARSDNRIGRQVSDSSTNPSQPAHQAPEQVARKDLMDFEATGPRST